MLHLWKRLREKCAVRTDTHDENGLERPDPRPVEMPLGFQKPPSIQEMIRRALQSERMRQLQEQRGLETLEDSMDFDIEDEPDLPLTPHEVRDMQEEVIAEGAAEYARQSRIAKRKAVDKTTTTDHTTTSTTKEANRDNDGRNGSPGVVGHAAGAGEVRRVDADESKKK